MNKRYRKVMRLKSRHYRRGHQWYCVCPEAVQSMMLAMKKRIESGEPLARRIIRKEK